MFLEHAADLHRALRRRFRIGVKDQHHPIARWDPNQTVRGFGSLKLFAGANNPVQLLNRRVLVVNRKLRVANDVDEQNMGDLELDLFLNLRRHVLMRVASTPEAIIQVLPYPVEEINIENHTSRRVARYQPARREAAEVRSLSRARESVRRADPSRDKNIVVGVLAVPAGAAQKVADDLVDAGVRIIFNYSEGLLDVPSDVTVHTSNPAVELLHALYFHLA